MKVAAVLGLGLVVAGCGHAAPSGLAPAAYAHQACTAVAAYEASLTTQAAAYQAKVTAARDQPTTLRALARTFLAQQVTGSTTLLGALQQEQRPGGDGGAAVKSALVAGARSAQRTFTAQLAAVTTADAADRTTFFAVLDTAQAQVQAAGEAIAAGIESVGQFGDTALNRAFGADTVCGGL